MIIINEKCYDSAVDDLINTMKGIGIFLYILQIMNTLIIRLLINMDQHFDRKDFYNCRLYTKSN